ncbi:transposase [Rhodobacteraceae bacterium]|nr:transposase [Paracoccaceae bacterium]
MSPLSFSAVNHDARLRSMGPDPRCLREDGMSLGDVAAELDAHECLLRKWWIADRRERVEKNCVDGQAFEQVLVEPTVAPAAHQTTAAANSSAGSAHLYVGGICLKFPFVHRRSRPSEADPCCWTVPVIALSSSDRIYLTTRPVDFRKGRDGLANYVMTNLKLAPFSGAFFVFRSKGATRSRF